MSLSNIVSFRRMQSRFSNIVWPVTPLARNDIKSHIYVCTYNDIQQLRNKMHLEMDCSMFVQYYIIDKYNIYPSVIEGGMVTSHDDLRYIGIANGMERINTDQLILDNRGQWIAKDCDLWIGLTKKGVKTMTMEEWARCTYDGFKQEVLDAPMKYLAVMKHINNNLDDMCSWAVYKCDDNNIVRDGDVSWTFPSLYKDNGFMCEVNKGLRLLCREKLKYRDT